MLAAGAVGACGSSSPSGNGVASKSASDIVSSATRELQNAKSVHLSGSLASGGQSIQLDLSILTGQGAKGTMTLNGSSLQLIAAGKYLYIKASAKFWQQHGGATAAQVLHDRWLKTPASSSGFALFTAFMNVGQLAQSLRGSYGTLSKESTSTINGQKAIAIKNAGAAGGHLYVATTGKPYPIEVSTGSSGSQRLDFDKYNDPVALEHPAQSIDISQLQRK